MHEFANRDKYPDDDSCILCSKEWAPLLLPQQKECTGGQMDNDRLVGNNYDDCESSVQTTGSCWSWHGEFFTSSPSPSSSPQQPNSNVREVTEHEDDEKRRKGLIMNNNQNYLNKNNTMTLPRSRRTSLRRKNDMNTSSSGPRIITQQHHLLCSSKQLILLFIVTSFFISISTSSEITSTQPQQQSTNNVNNNLNSSPVGSGGGNASGRNINSGLFNANTFGSSSPGSGSNSFSSTSYSGGGGNGGGQTSSTYDSTNSRPTAYFIAGLASQIRKINSTAMMLLTRDKPFQLQFRTVCPFGNIVYDDKFAISINSGGNMTYTTKPSEFPSSISHHSVADGRWHSISFAGDMIFLDDHDDSESRYSEATVSTPVIHWDTNSSNTEIDQSSRLNHMFHFFDGFVGCIRVHAPTHDHANGGRRQQSVQSHEENYFTPESPSEHQVVSLHDLFQLRTPFVPCNDTDVELNSVHSCFNPDTFVLCSKCQNGASCHPDTTDNPMNNNCECPPNTEEVEYIGKYCEYPPLAGTMHEELPRHSSSETEFITDLSDGDMNMPLSSPSNIDSSSANSSHLDLSSATRLDASLANHAEQQTTTTTTTTEPPPPEYPFLLAGSDCPCNHGGECVASVATAGQHYCNCTMTGYQGQYCDTDVDECLKFPGICNNGICQNLSPHFECFCRPGWTGKTCSKNYDECLIQPCKNGATCFDLVDNYRCECVNGYRGTDCDEEINECESSPCQNNGVCEDRLADFECNCPAGFEGKLCEFNIDECLSIPCQHSGRCMDKINGFECDCTDTGFSGDVCQDNVDDCTIDSCQHNATCIDLIKDFKCECHAGFSGKRCDNDVNECLDAPCLHGQCFEKSNQSLYEHDVDEGIRKLLPDTFNYETTAGYVCLCDPGFSGVNCQIDIDECALQISPCGRNGNCIDLINDWKCQCNAGFTGQKCESEINECESNPCVRGECHDLIGKFECVCPPDWGGTNCGVLLTGCVRDPCDKKGFAKCHAFYDEATNNHTFECECREGYTGKTCSLNTVMSFNGTGPVEVTNNDRNYENGNYELLFKFRTTLPDVLLIVGSGITYFYLTLSGGKLNLQSSLLNSLEGISVGQNLSNAELHKVWISVNSTHIALAADSQQTFYPIQTEDVHTGFNLTYIGGGMTNAFVNNPTKKVIKSQFIGCMQDIVINGESEKVIPDSDYLNSSNIEVGCKRTDQCKPVNPCQNSGNCTDLWQNFTCKCLRPYLGDRCQHEYIAATFQHERQNNSLVAVEILPEIGNKFVSTFDISMFIRTRKRNGTIFLLGNEVNGNYTVYLEAEVGEVGNLVVHAKWSDLPEDPNSKLEVYAVDGLQITDGSPHLVSIQREKGLVKISVNGTEHFRKSVGNRITFTPSKLYIGGKPGIPESVSSNTNHIESRMTRSLGEDGASDDSVLSEDATDIPDTAISEIGGEIRALPSSSSQEIMHEVIEDSVEVLVVNNPFKGVIQDVRVNFSSNEATPMVLGHSHLQQHAKVQNHFVVEFYPLEINSTYAMGEPLGTVTKQHLLQGVVSDDACKVNKCLNGGTCEVTWNDFKCNCAEGYAFRLCEFKLPCAIMKCPEGSTCQNIGWQGFECVSEVAFQGTGDVSPHYHLMSTELENVTVSSVSFRFRSKTPGNVLYVANGSQSFRIGLEEEVDSQNQSIDAVALYIDGVRHYGKVRGILDGRWHNVSMKLMLGEKDTLHLLVDSKDVKLHPLVEMGSIPQEFLTDLIKPPTAEIVVGSHVEHRDRYNVDHSEMFNSNNHVGHPEDAHNQFYRGCLDDIRLGEYRLPFVSPDQLKGINDNLTLATTTAPTAFYIVESSLQMNNLTLGCVVCYESECQNGGHCTQPQESFECTCASGFDGSRCQTNINDCDTISDCKNGAVCVDGIANYTCTCPPGWDGWKCDINIDECNPPSGHDPCNTVDKQATCIDAINAYTCVCSEEYLGLNCEKRKRSSCRDDPCENGATCHDRLAHYSTDVTFECLCAPGWEGDTCSTQIDYCKNVRCVNGGTCVNKLLGYECMCIPGYSSIHCEININDCLGQPCKNNGTCEDLVNAFQCHCEHTGYDGSFCEEDLDECEMPRICPVAQVCHNLPGTYACLCPDNSMCGEYCNILNPCDNQTCHNGGECKSVCYDEYNTDWNCECIGNYDGKYCELLTMAQPDRQIDILLIIIPVIAAILIAATIGVVILVRMARQKRATRGVYSPSQQEYCNPRVELDNVMKPPPEERLI